MKASLGAPTVQVLASTLGQSLLQVLVHPEFPDLPVSIPAVYDSRDVLPDTPGGILMLVGLDPASAEAANAVDAAAQRGFCAAVVKLRGQGHQNLTQHARRAGIALLALDDDVPWRQLDSLVTAMTGSRTSDDAHGEAAGTDLFMLANALASAADGAVSIEDLDRNVLAYSNLEHHSVDPLRRNGILARRVPEEEKNIWQYRKVMAADGVVHFPFDPSDGELARCAAPVRAGRRLIGSIWVIEDKKPMGAEAESALLESARLAAISILRQQSAVDLERQMRAEWLRSALEGHGSAPVTAGRFGLVSALPSVVAGFMFRAGEDAGTLPLIRQLTTAVEQYCGVFRSDVSCVSIGRIVYVLFPAVREPDAARRLAQGAVVAIGARLGHPVQAAISSARPGMGDLPDLRREADEVMEVMSGSLGSPAVASATDLHGALILRRLGKQFTDNPAWRHPGVAALLEHDAAKGTDYRVSLCAYFAAMGDIGSAAATLNIHPNTLRYRMRRAEALFELRLDDADDQLAVWLQLRLAGQ